MGTNWPLFHFAVREISVWTFRAVAVVLAGVTLLAVARARGQSLAIPREYWPTVVLATCFYLVYNIASTYSAILDPPGQASVLVSRCRQVGADLRRCCASGSAAACCWACCSAARRWAC